MLGSCAVCTEFGPKNSPWPGLTRPSTSSDRRNVAKKDVGGRVKPGQGVSVVVDKHHLATEFAEPDSRGLDPAIHVFDLAAKIRRWCTTQGRPSGSSSRA